MKLTQREAKHLQGEAEQHILKGEYKKAIKIYDKILDNTKPNTQRWNRYKDAKLDCEIACALDPLDLKQTLNDIVNGNE